MKALIRRALKRAKEAVSTAVDRLQAKYPPEKIVKLLAPFISGLAGAVATWLANHFPGLPPMPREWLAGIFGTVTLAALAAIYKIVDRAEQRAHDATQASEQRVSDERIAAITSTSNSLTGARRAVGEKIAADATGEGTTVA